MNMQQSRETSTTTSTKSSGGPQARRRSIHGADSFPLTHCSFIHSPFPAFPSILEASREVAQRERTKPENSRISPHRNLILQRE
jgi:hypothetical protein